MTTSTSPSTDDAGAIEAAAARLREAGRALRERPRAEVVEALAEWVGRWRSPDSPWQAGLARALAGATDQPEPTVRHGLALALDAWRETDLHRVVESELGRFDSVTGFDVTAVVLAGSIPMPSLLAVLWPLALQSAVLVKSAARDPVTAAWARRTLGEVDPLLERCVEPLAFDRDAEACHRAFVDASDCVVATGSDEAVAAWAARTPPSRRFVGFGHRLSIAVLGPEADLERAARDLAVDTALWDQLGCLSPVAAYTVGRQSSDRGHQLARSLADALADAEAAWPRAACPAAAAALASHERGEAEVRAADGQPVAVHADARGRWCVVAEADAAPRPAPLHRFLRVHPADDESALDAGVRPFAAHLAGVALEGFGANSGRVARTFVSLGASRVCAPGRLQAPPLHWHHDGRALLLPLARIADREIP